MTETKLEKNIREYLKAHPNNREPTLMAYFIEELYKEAVARREAKKRDLRSIINHLRLMAGV